MPENPPVFSIITPTCRRPDLLVRAINSVRRQTLTDYEHIIIDDANDSETSRIVENLSDDRILFFQHPLQKGAAGAYNSGIKLAKGKFIMFLDDDDEFMPSCLEKINNHFRTSNKELGFLWTGISIIQDCGSGEKEIIRKVWPSEFKKIEDGLVAATTIGNGYGLCIKKECVDRIGMYDESIIMGQDADFIFRLVRNFCFETVPLPLVKIHYHKNSRLTDRANDLLRLGLREKILESNADLLNQYPKLFDVHYKHLADLSFGSGLRNKGRTILLLLIKHNPYSVLNYLDLITYEVTGRDFFSLFHLRKLIRFLRRSLRSHDSRVTE